MSVHLYETQHHFLIDQMIFCVRLNTIFLEIVVFFDMEGLFEVLLDAELGIMDGTRDSTTEGTAFVTTYVTTSDCARNGP